MAGMKVWVPGEEVIAPDLNGYVQTQVVAVFTSAAQRTSQWPTPPNGALSTRTDTSPPTTEMYTGGAWRPLAGGVIVAATALQASQQFTTVGLRDFQLVAVPQKTYPTRIVVSSVFSFGFGSAVAGLVTLELVRNDTGAVGIAAATPIQAPASFFVPVPLTYSWDVAANADPGFKLRFNPSPIGGTGTYAHCVSTYTHFAR